MYIQGGPKVVTHLKLNNFLQLIFLFNLISAVLDTPEV